jgi:hypothetical protein
MRLGPSATSFASSLPPPFGQPKPGPPNSKGDEPEDEPMSYKSYCQAHPIACIVPYLLPFLPELILAF